MSGTSIIAQIFVSLSVYPQCFMVVIKTRLRKLTPVLTAAIIIRNFVWSDHAAERSLI